MFSVSTPFIPSDFTQPLTDMKFWLSKALWQINADVENDHLHVDDFMRLVHPLFKGHIEWYHHFGNSISQSDARLALQNTSFLIASAEKHFQAAGCSPGTALKAVDYLEDFLVDLSKIAQHPPVGTHYTYWLWNTGSSILRLVGDSGEDLFREVVIAQNNLQSEAVQLLRPIVDGILPVHSPEAAAMMTRAAQNFDLVREQYFRFTEKDLVSQERRLTVLSFTYKMRNALVSYPVKGVMYGGVNADNLLPPMQLDQFIGTTGEGTEARNARRQRYLVAEDIQRLNQDQTLPSIHSLLFNRVGWSASVVRESSEQALASHLFTLAPDVHNSLRAYSHLVKAQARLSGLHLSFIKYYLTDHAKHFHGSVPTKLVNHVTESTGGNGLDIVRGIFEARQQHPIISRFTDAIDLALSAPSTL